MIEGGIKNSCLKLFGNAYIDTLLIFLITIKK